MSTYYGDFMACWRQAERLAGEMVREINHLRVSNSDLIDALRAVLKTNGHWSQDHDTRPELTIDSCPGCIARAAISRAEAAK